MDDYPVSSSAYNERVIADLNADGTLIAAVHNGTGVLEFIDANTGKRIKTVDLNGLSAIQVQFSPDGKTVLFYSNAGILKMFNVATGSELYSIPVSINYGKNRAFSPDGKYIITRDFIREAATGDIFVELLNMDETLGISPDNGFIFTKTYESSDGINEGRYCYRMIRIPELPEAMKQVGLYAKEMAFANEEITKFGLK